MCEELLFQTLIEMKTNRERFYDLSCMFSPLLKKYARHLGYEDAYFDLQLSLFECLLKADLNKIQNRSDGAMVNYINNIIVHSYWSFSKRHRQYCEAHLFIIDVPETAFLLCELYENMIHVDCYSETSKQVIKENLTEKEYEIIILHYYHGYTISEIAKLKNVSRQSINQGKVRALEALRGVYL